MSFGEEDGGICHAGRRMGGYVMRGGGGGICHAGRRMGGYVMRGGGWGDMSCVFVACLA